MNNLVSFLSPLTHFSSWMTHQLSRRIEARNPFGMGEEADEELEETGELRGEEIRSDMQRAKYQSMHSFGER